jgi:H+/gluconate symporter-like permease
MGGLKMNPLIESLAPVFAAGIAIQQLLEILDPLIVRIVGKRDKKLVLGLVSLVVGLVLAFGAGLRVLEPLGFYEAGTLDALVTALIISAGTESFNSIIKFLGYAKEGKKGDAAALEGWLSRDPDGLDALRKMDRSSR